MKNIQQELNFIHLEKVNISDKRVSSFQLLNIAQTVLLNYINAEAKSLKSFYELVYQRVKNFYLEQPNR